MSSRPPFIATTLKLFLLPAIAAMVIGCSPEKQAKAPDNLIGLWNTRFNQGDMVLQKITSVAYNPSDSSTTIVFEPVATGEANLFKLSYDPKRDIGDQLKVDISRISNGSLSQIRISPGGKYIAVSGRTRELFLLKNLQVFAKFDWNDEITQMEFGGSNENILVVGDRKGKATIIDLEKAVILNSAQLFDNEVTSLAFYKGNHVLVAGNDPQIIQLDVMSGRTARTINTQGLKEKILHTTGLKHCHQERINQVLYVESQDKIVTSHGWDYCSDVRIAVWDAVSGTLVKEIRQIKYPVFHMAWVSKVDTLVLADHDRNLWKLSLADYKLSSPIHLPQSFVHFTSPNKNQQDPVLLGHVQTLNAIPGTNLLLIATGSYFKGGSSVVLAEIDADSVKIVARLVIDIRGYAHALVNEGLFQTMSPPSQ